MSKILTLTGATLKSFIRNWTSIVLLIIMPLILITLLFFSFNPNGIQKIPIGVISEYKELDIKSYENSYFSYLRISEYTNLAECTQNIKLHKEYICMNIHGSSPIVVDIYYDNTQNVVIWEILERIKSSVDYLQKQKSKEQVSDFLVKFRDALGKLTALNQQIGTTNTQIDTYIYNVDNAIGELSSAKSDLSTTISEMDQDISDIKSTESDMRSSKNQMYSSTLSYINYYESTLSQNNLPYDTSARNNLNTYNNRIESQFSDVDARVSRYETASSKGKSYMNNIDGEIMQLRDIKSQLGQHKASLQKSKSDIDTVQGNFNGIGTLDAELLINPIVLYNTPTYIPQTSQVSKSEVVTANDVIKGINLLSLQTIFPTMLFLIVLFLSLLVSNFIALSDINSPASQRIRLIRHISIYNMVSTYISSLIIVTIPMFCVLLMGSAIFQLPIFANFFNVFIILFMVASIFIMLGSLLAHMIRKESITLLATTFLLIFFIFLSGFILPTEKMSSVVGAASNAFPGKIGLNAFDKIVFYNLGTSSIVPELTLLTIWFIVMTVAVMIVRRIRG